MSTVSVIIPTIDGREKLLSRAVDSVMAQRHPADHIIVERDPDRTGAAATRNRALARVDTDYVAFLDDDDELLPSHLSSLMRYIGDYDLAFPSPVMVGGPDPTAVVENGRWRQPWGITFGPQHAHHIKMRGSFIPITHLVRTEAVRAIGGFPEGITVASGRYSGEDEQYLIALLNNGARFVHVNIRSWRWHAETDRGSTAGRGLAYTRDEL